MFTSLFFSLEVSLFHFFFLCHPLFFSQGVVCYYEGLSDAVVLCTQLCSLALVPDLTAVLLKNTVLSLSERSKNTILYLYIF